MESSGPRALNPQEKAQLKEKLALLRREYRRTCHRLQRARRAERVKTYVKKTVAEQNLLLLQEETEKGHAGSAISQVALATSEDVSVSTCPTTSPAKTASVTFKPEPEVFCQAYFCLPSTPTSKYTSQDCRKVLFGPVGSAPEKNQVHLSRSRTIAQQRVTLPLEKREESAHEALWRGSGCLPEQRAAASTGGSQSPVFKRRSNSIWEAQPNLSVVTTDKSSCKSTPLVLQPEDVQKTPPETLFPEDSHLFPCPLSCESHVASLDLPCQEGFCVSSKDSAREYTLSQEDLQNGRKGAAQMEEDQAHSGEEGPDLGRFADTASSSLDFERHGSTADVPGNCKHEEEGSPGEESHSSDFCRGDPPSNKSVGKSLGEQLQTDSPLLEEQSSPAAPAQKVLSSCTVVEGLLFPVEYYVRTTRRMSSRQRVVNLEAVIQGQLGKSKKGQKVTQEGRSKKPVLSSQEASENVSQAKALPSSSPAAFPPLQASCESSASNGVLTQSEGCLQTRRRRGRPRRRARCQASSGLLQGSLENSEMADGSLLSSEAQGREKDGPGGDRPTETPMVAAGSVGARQRGGKGPGEDIGHKAETEALCSSPVILDAETAFGFEGDLQEDGERPLGDSNAPQQAGSQSHDGSKEAQQDEASLAWKERGGSLHQGVFGSLSASWALPFHSQRGEAFHCQWLPPSSLDLQEFCLPEDEFGLLKSEKLKACAVKEPENLAAEGLPCGDEVCLKGSPPGETLSNVVSSGAQETLAASPFLPRLHQKCPSSSELFLSPALEGVSYPQPSLLPTPAFPLVGTTPASPALPASQVFPEVFCGSTCQAKSGNAGEPGTLAEVSPSFPISGTRMQCSQSRASWPAEEEMAGHAELPAGESLESSSGSPKQNEEMLECLVETSLQDMPAEGNLQMTSKLKSCSGSSSVDVGTVWWEAADVTSLCVVTASEMSVSLWRQLEDGHWAAIHTWHFTKVPVIQIVSLPEVRSLVCVALGCLEIAEIRFLFHSGGDSVNQSVIKAGNIKAVLGLRKRRLVTSCGSPGDQEVEVLSFSELGRSHKRQVLMPPEETILAFAEVDGMQEALVAMTATNYLVVWNLASGQLLRKMAVGCPSLASVCHRAYSDSGLLFVVLSHPHAKGSKAGGIPAFQVVAFNPKTAKSAKMMTLSLPLGTGGRYLEGEVRDASAAAVLTSGTIAVWDLFLGRCTAVLPPNSEGRWSLVRWSVTDKCLLAGQDDGSVYIYSYTPHLPPT